jgi:L-histidine N-alpha-methyltransferase
MNPEDRFLVGFDMIKPINTLEAAYNDSLGVTSAFNKNVLTVLNRELNADFNLSSFQHVAFFNEELERVEMHLQAREKIEVNVSDLDLVIELDKDETIHTEVCSKFSRQVIREMVSDAGLDIKQWFFDSKGWFSLAELGLRD